MTSHPLSALLALLPDVIVHGAADPQITAVVYDSRNVTLGTLFVATPGSHVDGHRFIPQAIAGGAAAVLYDDAAALAAVLPSLPDGVVFVQVAHARAALAPLSAAWWGYPAQRLRVVGVTGTKGKTTTATLCAHVLDRDGHRSGMVSTANFKVGPTWSDNGTRQTTPEAPEIQRLLHEIAKAGCDHAVIEASSHGLAPAWNRVGSCAFDVAVFTNVTHEHLDYHGSVEQYRADKARLFALLHAPLPGPALADKQRKFAIVNLDDPHAALFLAAAGDAEAITYGIEHPAAQVRAVDIALSSEGAAFTAVTPWGNIAITLHLPGRFNVLNALAALAVGLSAGIAPTECAAALAGVGGVTGRMERVAQGQPFAVIVDYAHNPDSFEQVMRLMRPLTNGQLICVFGSAGERDVAKRAIQGEIAGQFCDLVVITDEDPRDEDPNVILEQIAVGVRTSSKTEGHGYLKIADRAHAIRAAFAQAQPGDIVLLLGKGHETSIVYERGRKQPWLERTEAERALQEIGYAGV